MKTLLRFQIVWVLAVAAAFAAAIPKTPHYLNPSAIDLKAILHDPPADGSSETLHEVDILLEKQNNRTADDIARAKKEVKMTPFLFADVLGDWFSPDKLPLTAGLLKNVEEDANAVSEKAKTIWGRPRPPLQDKRIQPAVDVPTTASYPSGHSTRGVLFSLVIAELVPDWRGKLLARGSLVGEDRIIGGVHFPSDVEAGRVLGRGLFETIEKNETFQADLARAKAEVVATGTHLKN